MSEEWRKIPGVPWYYEVSSEGRMRSLARPNSRGLKRKTKILNPADAQGYLRLEDGTDQWFALAALVLLAFVGPPPAGCRLARHLNDDRTNNKPDNLAWGTDQDNINDGLRNGIDYVSYGHLGHLHSEATKRILSAKKRGKPTGHKMTEAHRMAMWAGYRKKYPEKPEPPQQLCECGCGAFASPGKRFIRNHSGTLQFRKIAKARIGRPRAW